MSNTQKNKTISIANDKIKIAALIVVGILFATNAVTFYLYRKEAGFEVCGGYSFINPRFACGSKIVVDKKGYAELKSRLNSYIEKKKSEGKADVVAIWFRDLEAGPTLGINEHTDFIPASLLKLPLALTYLQFAEDNPNLLRQKISYMDDITSVPNQTFIPRDHVEKGRQYTIDELIRYSIVDSDNVAAQLLYEYLEKNYTGELSRTYRNLGIVEPGNNLNMEAVNVKEYGSIFRMLYNVSFLNQEMSEKILSYLIASYFKIALMAGVPEDIPVANKFSERFLPDGSKQLHDCGIVYYPKNPYQLCIMTKGKDFNELSAIISEVSKQVYEEFDGRRL